MNSLIQFDKELRRMFQNPFSDEFGRLFNLKQEPLEKNKDYSVFKHNETGLWTIELPFPGLTQEDIQVKIDLETRQLSVTGSKRESSHEEKEYLTYTRRAELDRLYSFYMDEKFDLESMCAHCENGLLKLEFNEISNKQEESPLLEIKVQGSRS